MTMNTCKNCNEPINGNYCSNCGQPTKLKRIDRNYVIHEIAHAFHTEKGILYTIKKLLISPGEDIKYYITENRSRLVKPIPFLIIASLIYTVALHFFHIDAEYFYARQTEIEYPTVNIFLNWMLDHQGYVSIISGLFVALWVKLFFRKSGYNFFEIFIILCFLSGVSALISTFFVIFQGLTHWNLMLIASLIAFFYYVWAIGQFFGKKKAINYIKAFLSCLLGFYILGYLVTIVGIFIDITIK